MERSYAQALMKVIDTGIAPHDAVKALRELLAREGRERLMPKIARAFATLAAQSDRRTRVTLTIADERDRAESINAAQDALSRAGAQPSDVDVCIDESIIGGWRLEGQELLVDASYKRYLLDMYNRVTSA